MLTEAARKYFRILYEPPARLISTLGISPNVLTVVGFLLMVGIAVVLAQGYLFLGGILIIIAALFDAIDGTLARMMGRTSRFGAFLDSTLDRFSEAVIFLGLFIYLSGQNQKLELLLVYATVVGSLMVSSIFSRDYMVVQAITMAFACATVLVNFVVDVVTVALDPRIEL